VASLVRRSPTSPADGCLNELLDDAPRLVARRISRGLFRAQSFFYAPDDLAAIHFALADNLRRTSA
jgi:hypothetical protein